jgi:hypothetical protein
VKLVVAAIIFLKGGTTKKWKKPFWTHDTYEGIKVKSPKRIMTDEERNTYAFLLGRDFSATKSLLCQNTSSSN